MDASTEQDLGPLPAIGARVGVRYGETGPWLPFTVTEISASAVKAMSPIFGGRCEFAFALEDRDVWKWCPWEECPALRERCEKCKGAGEVMSKKKGETFRVCPTCKGKGEVARDDPFEAPN